VLSETVTSKSTNLDELSKFLSHQYAGAYWKKSQAGTLTGEFIVYAAYEGINYYLTLGKHGEYGHIAERIRACAAEFPFLDTLIASQ
jgi:hypothetical protein